MEKTGPLMLHEETVRPEWLDCNGHMNLAYYVLAFDHATDKFLHHLGLDEAYKRASGGTTFVLETHVVYRRELMRDDPMRFSTQLLGHDAKRLHFMHHMYHGRDGFLAAANEIMALHVSLETRRGAAMPAHILAKLKALQTEHDRLPRPAEAGRAIGLERKPA